MSKTETIALADLALGHPSNHDNGILEDVSAEKVLSQRAAVRADQVSLIRSKLASSTDGHLDRAASLLLESPGGVKGRLSDTDFATFRRSVSSARDAASLDRELAELESDFRSRVVVKEVDPYGKNSPHSWLCDTLNQRAPADALTLGRDDSASERADRLQRHAGTVARSVQARDKYGKAIITEIEARYRVLESDPRHPAVVGSRKRVADEIRALTTEGGATASASAGGAAAFVTPAILLKAWADYRSPFSSFIGQCDDSIDLPAYGLEVAIPQMTGGTSVTATVEGSDTSDQDPTIVLNTQAVAERSGQVTVSQAYLDRAGPGIRGDVVLFQQLKDQLDASFDAYALGIAIAGSATVAGISSFTLAGTSGVGGFTGDLHKAKKLLTGTAGVRLRATHAFLQDDCLDYVLAWADAQGRPIATPNFDDSRLPVKSAGDGTAQGYSGFVLSGLALFGDSNIPNVGTTTQENVVVCRGDSILWLGQQPTFYTMPSGSTASSLEAIVGVRSYGCAFPRWPTGVASITGAGYNATNFA